MLEAICIESRLIRHDAANLRALQQGQRDEPAPTVKAFKAYVPGFVGAAGRHSLQLEVNKRLYMDGATLQKHAGFEPLQGHLM